MNDDARPQQQRRRSRRRAENAPRRQNQRGSFTPRRRNDYASGQYSSIFTGPFPTDADEDGGLNLADLQAKPIDELRELAAEHDIEGSEQLEHSDLVLKLLDVVPLAPSQPISQGLLGPEGFRLAAREFRTAFEIFAGKHIESVFGSTARSRAWRAASRRR